MADFQIVPVSEVSEAYDALAISHGGVFVSDEVRKGESIENWAILDEDGRVFGGFNLEVIRLKSVKTLTVPEFHPHCALFTLPMEGELASVQTRQKKVLHCIADFLKGRSESITEITLPPDWIDMQPMIWSGFHCTVKYTYRLSLEVEDIPSRYTAKLRNSIKKAEKEGVVSTRGTLEELLHCLRASSTSGGFDLNEARVSQLVKSAGDRGRIDIAKMDDESIAAAFSLVDDQTEYYLFGGADRAAKAGGALALLLKEKMCLSKEEGRSVFDFEGSMIPGVERFFRDFGGQLTPYFQITKAPNWAIPLLRLRGRNEF